VDENRTQKSPGTDFAGRGAGVSDGVTGVKPQKEAIHNTLNSKSREQTLLCQYFSAVSVAWYEPAKSIFGRNRVVVVLLPASSWDISPRSVKTYQLSQLLS
jgi:hypothetical protein